MSQQRYQLLVGWAEGQLRCQPEQISLLSGDASFRCYYRVQTPEGSMVLVDADPKHEDNPSFVRIAEALAQVNVSVPQVSAVDYDQGFMLLSDLGDELLLPLLTETSAQSLYPQAMLELARIQKTQCALPEYDAAKLLAEMQLFEHWFLGQLLSVTTKFDFASLYQLLIDSALMQPQVFVHRDYHSRNLLMLPDNSIGVLDFQDAVLGPITYDLVSLLRDCYIDWPMVTVESWALHFKRRVLPEVDDDLFIRWFDWMGLQRHLKCVGIFTRLNLRDDKTNYMDDIPRVLNYMEQVAEKYRELEDFYEFITDIKSQYESDASGGGARLSS